MSKLLGRRQSATKPEINSQESGSEQAGENFKGHKLEKSIFLMKTFFDTT